MEAELAALRAEVRRLRAENTRLDAVLRLTLAESGAPGPAQTAVAVPRRGMVGADSPPGEKVAFFAELFAARRDVYAVRWENRRLGKAGWMRGFDCPALDTLFLAAPISFHGRMVQYVGRVLRARPVHDYVDVGVPVLAASVGKRARGYLSLGFPDPRGAVGRRS